MARRRKVAYQKRYQNRFSMCLVMEELELLEAQIEAEKQRELEIQEYGKEVQTKGYIENVAREKLGLVYEDEILFKQEK